MVEHKVGELVLMRVAGAFGKPFEYLGIIKKVDDAMRIGEFVYFVEWNDGQDNWYSSESIEEMKSDLWTYYESQNR